MYYQKQESIYITNHDTVKDINGSESRKTHSLWWTQMDSALLVMNGMYEKNQQIYLYLYIYKYFFHKSTLATQQSYKELVLKFYGFIL